MKLSEFSLLSRARKGVSMIREIKTNPYHIVQSLIINYKESFGMKLANENITMKLTELPISDRSSAGSNITKEKIMEVYEIATLSSKEEKKEVVEKENINLETIDQKIMTIDDFLKDLK
jgi:topoisomerase-4 subunit A